MGIKLKVPVVIEVEGELCHHDCPYYSEYWNEIVCGLFLAELEEETGGYYLRCPECIEAEQKYRVEG